MTKKMMNKPCLKCLHWDGCAGDYKSYCNVHDKPTLSDYKCSEFDVNDTMFCGICCSSIEEAEYSSVVCSEDDKHIASQWDYEWIDLGKG